MYCTTDGRCTYAVDATAAYKTGLMPPANNFG